MNVNANIFYIHIKFIHINIKWILIEFFLSDNKVVCKIENGANYK